MAIHQNQGTGWDRASRYEEQNGDPLTSKTSEQQQRSKSSQAKNEKSQASSSPKREWFFSGKCRHCGSQNHTMCVTTARQMPNTTSQNQSKLVKRQVITLVNEPTTWCSPVFFAPKADSKRVRLITDFTILNKFVHRPTHPFPSIREIIKAVPPDAKLFCKLNAAQGYFQLALDEKSSRLRTFLIQQGR